MYSLSLSRILIACLAILESLAFFPWRMFFLIIIIKHLLRKYKCKKKKKSICQGKKARDSRMAKQYIAIQIQERERERIHLK